MLSHLIVEPYVTQLCTYPVASADVYYSVVNQRVVCMGDESEHGFRVWAEIPDEGTATVVDLSRVFLEYAMTCTAMHDPTRARQGMEAFGKRLGELLAMHISSRFPRPSATGLGACALECVLTSMKADFTMDRAEGELRYAIVRCPLCATAESTGLRQVKLAHHGINALCTSLMHAINRELVVRMPGRSGGNHVFSVLRAAA